MKDMESKFLGKQVRDKVTGFEGTCTSHCLYITGPDRITVEAQATKGKRGESMYLDVERAEVVFDRTG